MSTAGALGNYFLLNGVQGAQLLHLQMQRFSQSNVLLLALRVWNTILTSEHCLPNSQPFCPTYQRRMSYFPEAA